MVTGGRQVPLPTQAKGMDESAARTLKRVGLCAGCRIESFFLDTAVGSAPYRFDPHHGRFRY